MAAWLYNLLHSHIRKLNLHLLKCRVDQFVHTVLTTFNNNVFLYIEFYKTQEPSMNSREIRVISLQEMPVCDEIPDMANT